MSAIRIVISGHVDHGKSTIIGRLLADTQSLPKDKLETLRRYCEKNAKPFEYAFLLDALKEEQRQGITLQAARIFFRSKTRDYQIIDAPGHVEFLKSMVSGASQADAALLVVDAVEGLRENTLRHAYLLSYLGLKQIAVLINKMDLVGYDEKRFKSLTTELSVFLKDQTGFRSVEFIPVSGFHGDGLAEKSPKMPWYRGPSLMEKLESFSSPSSSEDRPVRLLVQDVYRFTESGDQRRIVSGWISSGSVKAKARITFYPSEKKSRVKTLEDYPSSLSELSAPRSFGLTLEDPIYVPRGEIGCVDGESIPHVSNSFRAHVIWLGKSPLTSQRKYLLKLANTRAEVELVSIHRRLDTRDWKPFDRSESVGTNEVAECTFRATRPIAFDLAAENLETGRFVLVDRHEIQGGGLILQAEKTEKDAKINGGRQPSPHLALHRSLYHQQPALILFLGAATSNTLQKIAALEKKLLAAKHPAGSILLSNRARDSVSSLTQQAEALMRSGLIVLAHLDDLSAAETEEIKRSAEQSGKFRIVSLDAEAPANMDISFMARARDKARFAADLTAYLKKEKILIPRKR